MIKEVTAAGKDILEAKENARVALGTGELEDVQFEIIDAGTKGFFGFMARPAKVRAYIDIPDQQEKKPRFERPKKEGSENAPKAEKQEKSAPKEGAKKAEGKDKPRHKKQKSERREIPEMTESTAKPKSEVIPEDQLKMEKREVADGEDMSFDFVKALLSDIGLSSTAELYACEDGTRRIAIAGEDASVLIGHHGDTLDALQYLANLASMRKNIHGERDKSRVTIDIEGYRSKREATLRALARRMAAKALRNRRSVMLEPMSAYERRIIHSEVQDIEGVSTNSIGAGNNRKIVIFLTDKKPKGVFDDEEKATVTPLDEEFAPDEAATENAAAELDEYASDSEGNDDATVSVEAIRPADEITEDDEEIK